MKITTHILALALISMVVLQGCDDTLNLEPRDELSSSAVWQDAALTIAYLNQIYSNIGYGYGNPMPGAGAVDETIYTHSNFMDVNLQSTLTPDNRGLWNRTDNPNNTFEHFSWGRIYSVVRDINTFVENVAVSEALDPAESEVLLGEAYYLRAFFYHNLWRMYGGVPVVDATFELGQEIDAYQVPRNSFEETLDFILADIDRADTRLGLDGRRPGAATRGAALALKSRVLLYAASDLYNLNPSGAAETGFSGGDQTARLQAALDAAEDVMNLGLYGLAPAPTPDEYQRLIVRGGDNGFIWGRFFNGDGADAHNHSLWISPNGYGSWSGDTPLQNHVDAYEMSDGSEFSWDNPEHAANPYANRDPRFEANILYNGRIWRGRVGGAAEIDPRGIIQTGFYEVPGEANLRPGLDTREGPIQNWNGTRSGYNMAKFLSSEVIPETQQAFNPWVHFRYAEILLNYAEAAALLGQEADALMALNQVRARVGMPDVPAGGSGGRTVLEHIQRERQIELAFEGHRYFDVRRWMIAPEVYSVDNMGIRITGRLDPNGELLVNNTYRYEYEFTLMQRKAWDDKNYFVPIPRGEINRNPTLTQNPGYN